MTKINIQSPGGASLEDGNLRIKDGLPIDATLQTVSDVAGNDSALQISTDKVKAESAQQCPLEVESTGTGGGIALLDNTTTDNTSVGIGALGDNLCFRSGGVPEGNMRLTDTGRLTIKNDTSATTQNTVVIAASEANSGIALVPNGTGAITADIPDGTTTGGNARGANAVDFQMSRTSADQVAASPNSVIAGGANNRIRATTNTTSVISGGDSNLISSSGSGTNNTIAGGFSNSITGSNSNWNTISGGASNNASTTYNTISGGQSNTASTGTHATVVGGQSNVSSGQHSISGGFSNVASSAGAVAFGYDNDATNNYASAFGRNATAYLYGQNALGSGFFDVNGTAQASTLVARKFDDLTTGGTTVLSLDGTGTTNLIIPQGNNRVWNVLVKTVAVVIGTSGTTTGVTVGDTFLQNQAILFKKIGGISSVVDLATDNTFADGGMGTANMAYTAGASQELALTFTAPIFIGGGSVSLRIVSKVELVEVAYA
jgi:hypothetical protein